MDQENKNNEGIDLRGSLKDSGTGVKFEEYRAPRSYYPAILARRKLFSGLLSIQADWLKMKNRRVMF